MNTLQLINQIYAKVNGEYETIVENSDDFISYLNSINRKLIDWANEPDVKWKSLYNPDYLLETTVASDIGSYPIGNVKEFGNSIHDNIYFINPQGEIVDTYKLVGVAGFEVDTTPKRATIAGNNLLLKTPIDDKLVGCKVRIPVYINPPLVSLPTDIPQIDSISWLIAACAADMSAASPVPFIARNAERFDKEADRAMLKMKQNNRISQAKTYDDRNPLRYSSRDMFKQFIDRL